MPNMTPLHNLLLRIRPAPIARALKRILRIKRSVFDTEFGRIWIDPVSQIGASVLKGEYEPTTVKLIRRHFHGGIFVDIGANEGLFSLLAASTATQVIAVEPQSRLQPIIKENIRLNGAHNISVVRAAISDHKGLDTFHLTPDTNTGSSGLARYTRYGLPTELVSVMTLEDLFEEFDINQVDFMKMDIESYEYESILGSRNLFKEHRIKAFIVEFHDGLLARRGLSTKPVYDFLAACGYSCQADGAWLIPSR